MGILLRVLGSLVHMVFVMARTVIRKRNWEANLAGVIVGVLTATAWFWWLRNLK